MWHENTQTSIATLLLLQTIFQRRNQILRLFAQLCISLCPILSLQSEIESALLVRLEFFFIKLNAYSFTILWELARAAVCVFLQ